MLQVLTMRIVGLVLSCAALAACASADRQVRGAAYDACSGRSDGEARDRCIAQERARLRAQQDEADRACLESIEDQRRRTAVRRGASADVLDRAFDDHQCAGQTVR
ncbi:MAG: hypothetical protein AAF788_03055 [Pseudomonadota bacterium]